VSLDNAGEATSVTAITDTYAGTPQSFDLVFDYRRPPVTANDRLGWRATAKHVASIRLATKLLARRVPHYPAIEVSLTWIVSDRRKRDGGENLAPTLKPMIDGLVDADVVDDDDQAHVRRGPSLVEFQAGAVPHMVLRITPIHPEPQEAAAA
jgi:crossover junction endodeoxyribonuclease RusA